MRTMLIAAAALTLAGCTAGSEPPVAAQQAPARPVAATPAQPSAPVAATAAAPAGVPAGGYEAGRAGARTGAGMALAPGARESAGVSNVSRTASGNATSGNAVLGGTIVSGQGAGVIPSTIDRNREPPRRVRTAPADGLGPGTAPPVVQPELRDTTGRTLRNRQSVDF